MTTVTTIFFTVCRRDVGMGNERYQGVVKVGVYWLKDVRFADDQLMVASTERGLQQIIGRSTI